MNWIKRTYKNIVDLAYTKNKQRQFAFLFSVILLAFGVYFGFTHSFVKLSVLVSIGVGVTLLLIGLIIPLFFIWPLIIWLFIGKIMGEITSTVILGVIYFFVFSPITLIKRLFLSKKTAGWVKRKNSQIDYKKLY